MFIDELKSVEMDAVAKSFALWLSDEVNKRGIHPHLQDKMKLAFLNVPMAPKESWLKTIDIGFYRISAPPVDGRRCWQYCVVESNNNDFVTHVLGFLDNVHLIEQQKLYDANALLWRDKYLPIDYQTSRYLGLIRQYAQRGEEFIASNIEHARNNSKTNFFSYLSFSFSNDYGLDIREKKAKREKVAMELALKIDEGRKERDHIVEMVETVSKLPEAVYLPLYETAKAFLIETTKGNMPETFLTEWSIHLIMTDLLRKQEEEKMEAANGS